MIEVHLKNKLAIAIKEQERSMNLIEGEIDLLNKAIDAYMERI